MTVQIPLKVYIGGDADKGKDTRISNFICWYFLIAALNLAVKMIWGDFGAWSWISKGILALFLAIAFLPITREKILQLVVVEFLFAVLFFLTWLQGTQNTEFKSIVFNALAAYVPIGLCVINIDSIEVLLKKLYIYSYPTQIFLLYVAVSFKNVSGATYSMSVGYYLLFQMLICLDHFFSEKKSIDIAICLTDLIAILLYGSRGPILCIAAFFIIKILTSFNFEKGKKLFLVLTIILLLVLLYYLLDFLIPKLPDEWLKSRTLSLYLSDALGQDSGRMRIYSDYLRLIRQRPWFGFGIAGGWMYSSYPHNLEIELMLSFGIPIGCLCFIFILCKSLHNLSTGDKGERRLLAILITVLVELQVSGSFIMTVQFFMLFAMCIRGLQKRGMDMTLEE